MIKNLHKSLKVETRHKKIDKFENYADTKSSLLFYCLNTFRVKLTEDEIVKVSFIFIFETFVKLYYHLTVRVH